MGGIDRVDQHRVVGAGFANVAHFKEWYKKAFFGIADFHLLQAFTAWNLSIDASDRKSSDSKQKKIVKLEFYSVMAGEMMSYIDRHDDGNNDGIESNNKKLQNYMYSHYPKSYFQFDKKISSIDQFVWYVPWRTLLELMYWGYHTTKVGLASFLEE